MGHYASEVGYEDKFSGGNPMQETNGAKATPPKSPSPIVNLKPKTTAKSTASLSSVFAQATELAKLWEATCPAARTLFLASIEAAKKE